MGSISGDVARFILSRLSRARDAWRRRCVRFVKCAPLSREEGVIMVSNKGMFWLTMLAFIICAGSATAPAQAFDNGPALDFIPAPPDEAPSATPAEEVPATPEKVSGPTISDGVYRVEKSESGEAESGEVDTELTRWHGGWGRGWGGGGWGRG